jgi:hypothetical protein
MPSSLRFARSSRNAYPSDPVRRTAAFASVGRVQPTLSQRKKPSRERQPAAFSGHEPKTNLVGPPDSMSSQTRRPAQILPARRMNIFTKRGTVTLVAARSDERESTLRLFPSARPPRRGQWTAAARQPPIAFLTAVKVSNDRMRGIQFSSCKISLLWIGQWVIRNVDAT